jgi:hypothetical protein
VGIRVLQIKDKWRSGPCRSSGPSRLRSQEFDALADEGAMALGGLWSRLRYERNPVPAVMAMACLGLIELDLVATPIGPATLVRHRGRVSATSAH